MDHIFDQYNKTGYLHHAYVIEGLHADVIPVLVSHIEKHLKVVAKNNPDFMVARHGSFNIDAARMLKDVQTRAAWSGTRKIYVIGADSFTHEAQNALLKTFEEPTAGTHFFIILPRAAILLPTLRSRVLLIESGATSDAEAKTLAGKFVAATLENRFALIKKLTEKKKDEPVDRELLRRVLDNVEHMLYARTRGQQDGASTEAFQELLKAKAYLATRGASPKMLMEHIAMVI